MRGTVALLLAGTLVVSCGSAPIDPTARPTTPASPTPESTLARLNGTPLEREVEEEFGRVLDMMATGVGSCVPEPDRARASDLIVASWEQAERPGPLIEWARSLIDLCG